jgi:hypothetical protein
MVKVVPSTSTDTHPITLGEPWKVEGNLFSLSTINFCAKAFFFSSGAMQEEDSTVAPVVAQEDASSVPLHRYVSCVTTRMHFFFSIRLNFSFVAAAAMAKMTHPQEEEARAKERASTTSTTMKKTCAPHVLNLF